MVCRSERTGSGLFTSAKVHLLLRATRRFEIRQHGACRALLHFGAYPFVQGVDVRKREAVPHGAADDWIRVVFRQDRAEHVERTDV